MKQSGIYGYYDIKKQYVVYIGKDADIGVNKRDRQHKNPSTYDRQAINKVIQNNPQRYKYFQLIIGNYTDEELLKLEKEFVKMFKTFKYEHPERSVFNFTPGGDFNPSKVPEIIQKRTGYKHSKESKQKMSEARSGENHPFYNKKLPTKTRIKMSKHHNSTGYYRVYKEKKKDCKQGFTWRYKYTDEDGKIKRLNSVDINKLEKKVKDKGLLWMKFEDD